MMNYRDFLSSKTIQAIPTGIDVPAEKLNPMLYDFQRDMVRWALRRGRAALFCDCGLGKTPMQLSWADQVPGRVLILAPLAVAQQTCREGKKFGIDVTYARSTCDARITITNYEMLDRFNPADYAGIVLDECFSGETWVDIPGGRKHIKDIRTGDAVLNSSGIDTVSNIHRREVPYAVKVQYSGTHCVASPNHPFFTQRGWVGAQDLRPGDYTLQTAAAVHLVRGNLRSEIPGTIRPEVLRDILLSEMADGAAGDMGQSPQPGDRREAGQEPQRMAEIGESECRNRTSTDPGTEPNFGPGSEGENFIPIEGYAPQTFRAWRQWPGHDRAAAIAPDCAWKPMESGVCLITGQTDSRLSDVLQVRLGESRSENPHRGGWVYPRIEAGPGCEEGCPSGWARVDGIEILEPGNPGLDQFRDAAGRIYFYDLGGTRHPSFSVNGSLVHNSSILKSYDGKFRNQIIDSFRETPFKLACTATPAPNDHMELGNHAEFFGILSRTEMLSTFFVHDGGDTSQWRLKGHAQRDFWQWVCSWAVMIRKPSDLGYEDGDFTLPPLVMHQHIVEALSTPEGALFALEATTLQERQQARKGTTQERCQAVADLVAQSPDEAWLIWTNLNIESETVTAMIPGAVQITGSDTNEQKESRMLGFSGGSFLKMVTKPSIAGYGMNWQHCRNVAFLGLSDSYEQFYQAVRRSYRFGQKQTVNCHIVTSDIEGAVVANIQRKEADAARMAEEMVNHMRDMNEADIRGSVRTNDLYEPRVEMIIPSWLVAA